MYKIKVGAKAKDEIVIKAHMPGAVDFEKGIVKVDYQLWPFFQAIDLDHILVCIEVAMSQTGRVIFTSRHTHMLSVVVNTLRYILDMRGWDGITIPMIHAVGHQQRKWLTSSEILPSSSRTQDRTSLVYLPSSKGWPLSRPRWS